MAPSKRLNGSKPTSLSIAASCDALPSATILSLSNSIQRLPFDCESDTLSLELSFPNLLLFASFPIFHFHSLSVFRSQPLIVTVSHSQTLISTLLSVSQSRSRSILVFGTPQSVSRYLGFNFEWVTEVVSISASLHSVAQLGCICISTCLCISVAWLVGCICTYTCLCIYALCGLAWFGYIYMFASPLFMARCHLLDWYGNPRGVNRVLTIKVFKRD